MASPPEPGFILNSAVEPIDWVELFNNASSTIDLTNYSLTDNAYTPKKWVRHFTTDPPPLVVVIVSPPRSPVLFLQWACIPFSMSSLQIFPNGTTIGANGYLLLICDKWNYRGQYIHTNFNLDSDGDYIGLYAPNGNLVTEWKYPKSAPFYTIGYSPATKSYRYLFPMTPGKANPNITGSIDIVSKPSFSAFPPLFLEFLSSAIVILFVHYIGLLCFVLDFDGGFYSGVILLNITCDTPNATIYYTIDGQVHLFILFPFSSSSCSPPAPPPPSLPPSLPPYRIFL